jgi:hypothetical protein
MERIIDFGPQESRFKSKYWLALHVMMQMEAHSDQAIGRVCHTTSDSVQIEKKNTRGSRGRAHCRNSIVFPIRCHGYVLVVRLDVLHSKHSGTNVYTKSAKDFPRT